MKRNVLTVVIGAALIVIFALLLFVFQVRLSEVAVVTTFGKPVQNITEPGAYFKWPWPIQKVYKFDQRVQNFEDKYSENLTKDQINLMTSVYVGWKISDAARVLSEVRRWFRARRAADAGKHFAQRQERGHRHEYAGRVSLTPIRKQLKFDEIEREIQQTVQDQLETNNCGMELEFLGFKKIGLPENITQAVFARMTSDRQILINKYTIRG